MVCILVAVRSSTADVLKDQLQRRLICFFFFFKQKTAYEMRISDWSSDVCSSDLARAEAFEAQIAALKDAKEQLSAQFSEIGGKLLHQAQSHFLERADQRMMQAHEKSEAQLRQLLHPVNETIQRYDQKNTQLEQQRRSEERRVGKEGVSTCRYRGA